MIFSRPACRYKVPKHLYNVRSPLQLYQFALLVLSCNVLDVLYIPGSAADSGHLLVSSLLVICWNVPHCFRLQISLRTCSTRIRQTEIHFHVRCCYNGLVCRRLLCAVSFSRAARDLVPFEESSVGFNESNSTRLPL